MLAGHCAHVDDIWCAMHTRKSYSHPQVVSVAGLTHGYNGAVLFENAQLLVERGQRIAFLGPNGAGKSTLLRLIMNLEEPSVGGQANFGPSVLANYFQQVRADVCTCTNVMHTLVHMARLFMLKQRDTCH